MINIIIYIYINNSCIDTPENINMFNNHTQPYIQTTIMSYMILRHTTITTLIPTEMEEEQTIQHYNKMIITIIKAIELTTITYCIDDQY